MDEQSIIKIIPFEQDDVNIIRLSVCDLLGRKLLEEYSLPANSFLLEKDKLPSGYSS